MANLSEIHVGDVFSESSHYIMKEIKDKTFILKHLESREDVELGHGYVQDLLKTANQYSSEVNVNLIDTKWTAIKIKKAIKDGLFTEEEAPAVGELHQKGIRTIFESIHSAQVFTAAFFKKDKPLSKKAYDALLAAQMAPVLEEIDKTKGAKKGVSDKAKELLLDIQKNPIYPYEKGELRILTGYKIQFDSIDGGYKCFDMSFPDGEEGENIRPVNITTLQWIIYDDVKYNLIS